ncbi:unnamed protein product [Protopolystoma xenopodis]|uniref:Uncharacterized protein n=1 Tax=Protopolystoma xenopodis TaxID=117903 RepID=A0A3S5AI86_9PLAT|nr:unnamed protein product [Protopolystoma xenopodis]
MAGYFCQVGPPTRVSGSPRPNYQPQRPNARTRVQFAIVPKPCRPHSTRPSIRDGKPGSIALVTCAEKLVER